MSELKPQGAGRRTVVDQGSARDKLKTIENAIHQIYKQNASQLSFQNLYTSAYVIVLHKHGDMLYTSVERTVTGHIEECRGEVLEVAEGSFLDKLLDTWEKHRTAAMMIRDILMYMDKNYVNNDKQKKGVYQLAVHIFGEVMLLSPKILELERKLALSIVRAERTGETPPQRFLLKNLTKMMCEVGKTTVYEPCLESPFLAASTEFYSLEADKYIDSCTTPDYIRKVFKRLAEERDRISRCLDESTKPKIESVIKDRMVIQHKQQLIEKEHSGCLSMLRDWRVDDIKLLYECMKLVNDIQDVVTCVREYLLNWGRAFVSDPANNGQPVTIIEGILDQREKYTELLNTALTHLEDNKPVVDRTFEAAINKAFEDIVNKNQRIPEYLSLYVDSKLRKGKTQARDEDLDTIFDRCLIIFRYLKEKDVFEKYYKNHLAKRLLGGKSGSDEGERAFISKLRKEYGCHFTAKLEGMFTDMANSATAMESFKEELNRTGMKPPVDVSVQVLTTTYWPVPTSTEVTIPQRLTDGLTTFKHFYLKQHTGRKLQWQYNMGNSDVKLFMPPKPGQTAPKRETNELNVSTFQMIVLLLFNNADTLTIAQLKEATQIHDADMKKAILSLCHGSKTHGALLLKEGKDFGPGTKLTFNKDFKSKLFKVKISQVVQKETDQEAKDTRSKVQEERQYHIDAAIVRVMKSRKQEEHRLLVLELVKIFSGKFTPSPDDIKRRIEDLIAREYLERAPDCRSRYVYKA
eukprot:NODE_185_length_2391_cov_79.549912_g180_i0.p1 GENE.NODE_185_length_2391_cov_79.549912_g180_i0~~NODE_185_length_2391_cov_79.549912_g180_i0.p1  ORF type:complete len:747 (+),score=212.89 NODE_185_length_2391_cov_79.549912_g180_i0:78-2318(+)